MDHIWMFKVLARLGYRTICDFGRLYLIPGLSTATLYQPSSVDTRTPDLESLLT